MAQQCHIRQTESEHIIHNITSQYISYEVISNELDAENPGDIKAIESMPIAYENTR